MNSLAAGLQDHLEEMQKERESLILEETEEEDNFEDEKETGSITSDTSKTQRAAEDIQTGTAKKAVPRPPVGEGGHQSMPQLSMVMDKPNRQNHWGCNQWFQRQEQCSLQEQRF